MHEFAGIPGMREFMAQAPGNWGVMQQETHLIEGTLVDADVTVVLPAVPSTMVAGGYNTFKVGQTRAGGGDRPHERIDCN